MDLTGTNRKDLPRREHLQRLPVAHGKPPVFLVTSVVRERRAALGTDAMAEVVVSALGETSERYGWLVGRYVIMPDHVHFFCSPAAAFGDLSRFVGGFKERATRAAWAQGRKGRLWQAEFFDHLLRSTESYEEKWHYVWLNLVRAGLCTEPGDWPYQGEIEVL
ncbi:MAG TPA: transposase [Armatimonadota bacterium]|jgi:REP element-mobilizing transposase RayT